MTAVIDEERIVTEDEFPEFSKSIPCIGHLQGVDCPNEAKFKCRMICCSKMIFFCEDCLLNTKQHLMNKQGSLVVCQYCDETMTCSPSILVYLGRIN